MPWWALLALPSLAAAVLALPCFRFTYLWDDYDFLARAHPFRLESLLPDAGTVFYRPLSREVLFAILGPLGMSGPAVGHVVNAALLVAAVLLTGWLGARLVGRKEGILAACVLSTLGAASILVGWLSGSQDLLAAVLGLLAIHLRLSDRTGFALAALAAAILSKETAVAFAPVVALLPWIVGRASPRASWGAAAVALLLVGWAAIHPGVRMLLDRKGATNAEAEYVAVGAPGRPEFVFRSALALLNVPATGTRTRWPEGRTAAALLAGALVAAAILGSRRMPRSDVPQQTRRTLVIAILLLVGPLLVTVALVSRWSPYYTFLPSVGLSLAAGLGLARLQTGYAAITVLAFLCLGVWSRGLEADPTVTTERSLEDTSLALRRVQEGFERVYPELPERTQLLISVSATGSLSVPIHLLRYAAPRVWYEDPDLVVRSPQGRLPWKGTDVLVRVTHTLDVVAIDPFTLDVRYTGPAPDASEVNRPVRTYARSLGATGEPERAVQALLGLEQVDVPAERAYDRRLAAMILHQARRRPEAERMLEGLKPWSRQVAMMSVAKLMLERSGDPAAIDSAALFSMGLQPDDPEPYRYLLQRADQAKDRELALLAARRVLAIVGTDPEVSALLRRYESEVAALRITAPASR